MRAQHVLRVVPALLFLAGCATIHPPLGAFVGVINSGGVDRQAETVFFGKPVGDVSATYWYLQDSEKRYGQLRSCTWESETKVRCQWHDQAGTGVFSATFSQDFGEFSGAWGLRELTPMPTAQIWNGKRS